MVELTDVDGVRQSMQKSLRDKLQDEDLEVLILQASEAIARATNREFGPTNGATRSFEYTPTDDVLDLAPYEIRTLTKAQLDPEVESGVELTSRQYRLRPYPARDGTFFGLRLYELPSPKPTLSTVNGAGSTFPFFTRRIDITGDWGMTSVPEDVRHWANVTVEAWAQLRREGPAPDAFGGEYGSTPIGFALPVPVWQGLRPWMRPEALV
jgi:hypothetical protein